MEVGNNAELCMVNRRRYKHLLPTIQKVDNMYEVKRVL